MDIDFYDAVERIVKHCFNFSKGAKHLHDMLKIFGWPNLYSKDFSIKNEDGYYVANPETNILITLLALRQATVIYSMLLKNEVKIIRCDEISYTTNGSSLHRRIVEFYNFTAGQNLTVAKRVILISCRFEILIDSEIIENDFVGVFCIAPDFPEITNGYPLNLITCYFELDKLEQCKPLNLSNPSNNEVKNFSTKEEALERCRVILDEIDKRYPLTGPDGLIRIIIKQNNRGKILSEKNLIEQEQIYLESIEHKFFNGKKMCDCSNKDHFLVSLHQ